MSLESALKHVFYSTAESMVEIVDELAGAVDSHDSPVEAMQYLEDWYTTSPEEDWGKFKIFRITVEQVAMPVSKL